MAGEEVSSPKNPQSASFSDARGKLLHIPCTQMIGKQSDTTKVEKNSLNGEVFFSCVFFFFPKPIEFPLYF